MKTLRNLLLNELADIYDAEKRLVRTMPKLEAAAAGQDLKRALRGCARDAAHHVGKIERVFQLFGVRPRSRPCEATIGLLREVEEIVSEFKGSPAIDAAVISAAQKIEHYEIVSYGCLREWSTHLGSKGATAILADMLEQERSSDEALTRLARDRSNEQALGENGSTRPPGCRVSPRASLVRNRRNSHAIRD